MPITASATCQYVFMTRQWQAATRTAAGLLHALYVVFRSAAFYTFRYSVVSLDNGRIVLA